MILIRKEDFYFRIEQVQEWNHCIQIYKFMLLWFSTKSRKKLTTVTAHQLHHTNAILSALSFYMCCIYGPLCLFHSSIKAKGLVNNLRSKQQQVVFQVLQVNIIFKNVISQSKKFMLNNFQSSVLPQCHCQLSWEFQQQQLEGHVYEFPVEIFKNQ